MPDTLLSIFPKPEDLLALQPEDTRRIRSGCSECHTFCLFRGYGSTTDHIRRDQFRDLATYCWQAISLRDDQPRPYISGP
jgi:hypothetical protein